MFGKFEITLNNTKLLFLWAHNYEGRAKIKNITVEEGLWLRF